MRGRVAVLTTGGTIASLYDPVTKRHKAAADGESLLAALPRRPPDIEIALENVLQVHSFNMSCAQSLVLAARLRERLAAAGVLGAVVTQGTDTLEENAYLLDLILDVGKPVVLTGAQLPADHPQSDGPRNLADAIDAAGAPAMAGQGVTVCFNGQIHAARDVTKLHASALESFTSLGHGALGAVDEGRVTVYRRMPPRPCHTLTDLRAWVPLIRLVMDSDSLLLDAAIEAKVDGLVIEGFGRGNVVASFTPRIAAAIKRGIPVVVTSRCPEGRVKPIYGTGGGGRELEDAGVIFAGDLKGAKARLLLMVLLSTGLSGGRILEAFNQHAL
jgi:L-asparaginase